MTDFHTGTTQTTIDSLDNLTSLEGKNEIEHDKNKPLKKSILRTNSRFLPQKKDGSDDSIEQDGLMHPHAHVSFKENGVEVKEIKPIRRRHYYDDFDEADGWGCCNVF